MNAIQNATAIFKDATQGDSFYFFSCDGHCYGTEFFWSPVRNEWIVNNLDAHELTKVEKLYLIYTELFYDNSVLDGLDCLSLELGNYNLGIVGDIEGIEFTDDYAVLEVGNPADGVSLTELVDSE